MLFVNNSDLSAEKSHQTDNYSCKYLKRKKMSPDNFFTFASALAIVSSITTIFSSRQLFSFNNSLLSAENGNKKKINLTLRAENTFSTGKKRKKLLPDYSFIFASALATALKTKLFTRKKTVSSISVIWSSRQVFFVNNSVCLDFLSFFFFDVRNNDKLPATFVKNRVLNNFVLPSINPLCYTYLEKPPVFH